MAKNKGRVENLVPLTTEKAREIGREGGKKSVESRREKKLLSQIYGELLADEYEIEIDGKKTKITGTKLVQSIAHDVLNRRDSSSVSMLKEIREATEGNKMTLAGKDGGPVEVSVIKRVIVDNQGKSN